MEAVRAEYDLAGMSKSDNVLDAGGALGLDPVFDPMSDEAVAERERREDASFRRIAARRRPLPPEILLDGPLALDAAAAVAEGRSTLTIGDTAAARMRAAHHRLQRCVEEKRVVYGVTTGFGPLADRLVSPEDIETLQRNLVYHLATGVGDPLPWAAARATLLARISSMAQGWSGVSETTVDLMTAVLNSPYAPFIPEKGTVGASGDLTPLAHAALALMGEGAFIDKHGQRVDPIEAFYEIGRKPLSLAARDGLALVNGTSAMTGIAVLNGVQTERLLAWSEALTVGYAELLNGRLEAWRAEFAEARPHPGQAAAAAALRARAEGGARLDPRLAGMRRLDVETNGDAVGETTGAAAPGQTTGQPIGREARALQDAYSIRCAPQVLGAVRDVAAHHQITVSRELNAATDNPIFGDGPEIALHGGNFMGCHVAFASDSLTNAVIMMAALAERQVARLTDETRNGGLPAFLHRGSAGLNSGLMGAQVTATALLAEMRARGGAASTQTISTNGDNQDVVSMGTIAARGCAETVANASRILAIQALAVAQGVDVSGDRGGFSPSTRALAAWVRRRSAALDRDRPLSADIEALATALRASPPPDVA